MLDTFIFFTLEGKKKKKKALIQNSILNDTFDELIKCFKSFGHPISH